MNIKDFAKFMLLYSEQIKKPPIPINKKTFGHIIFEENTKVSVEFKKIKNKFLVNLKLGDTEYNKMTLDEFEELLNYREELIIKKIIKLLKELSIKYYGADIGFKEIVKSIFYKNIKKSDIEMIGKKIGLNDFIMDIKNYSVNFDDTEITSRKNFDFVAKELLIR